MFTAFKQSLKSLLSNKGRTVLTTLGIVIGISTVILVLSAGAGFRGIINDQIATLGTNTLAIATRVPPTTKNRSQNNNFPSLNSTVAITSLKMKDLQDIRLLPNVSNTYGLVVGQAAASYKQNKKSLMYFGVSSERFDIDKGTLQEGRFFTEGEDTGAAQVVILGSSVSKDLFDQDEPLGKYLRIGNLNFLVIGVYNSRGGAIGGQDDGVFMPLVTAQKKMLGIDYIIRGVIEMKDINSAEVTAEDIRTTLRHNHDITDPTKDDFTVATQADILNTLGTIFNGITFLLIAIAAISLMVGGVGIMNIMYVVVTERTAEIGLKKALGAKPADILYEFLIEAILVTVIGGIIGIIFGSFLGFIVSLAARAGGLKWAFSVPWYAIVLGFGVSAAIGIGFGVLPARTASKLDPIEALRYE